MSGNILIPDSVEKHAKLKVVISPPQNDWTSKNNQTLNIKIFIFLPLQWINSNLYSKLVDYIADDIEWIYTFPLGLDYVDFCCAPQQKPSPFQCSSCGMLARPPNMEHCLIIAIITHCHDIINYPSTKMPHTKDVAVVETLFVVFGSILFAQHILSAYNFNVHRRSLSTIAKKSRKFAFTWK